jgi:hypothetical protein
MALPRNRPINETVVSAGLSDIGTAGSAFAVAPVKGRIERAFSVIGAAISGADSTWSIEINGSAVTGSSVTVANAGSAAGDVDSCEPTGAHLVDEGDTIEFVNAGESTGPAPVSFFAVIRQ